MISDECVTFILLPSLKKQEVSLHLELVDNVRQSTSVAATLTPRSRLREINAYAGKQA